MLIWPKHVTVGLCCLISCDGSIHLRSPKDRLKHNRKPNSGFIDIFNSVEIEWAKNIQKILLEHKIGTSLGNRYRTDIKKNYYVLRLNRRYPKQIRKGMDQYQIFRNSIEYWNAQQYLIKRKYEALCKMTKLIPVICSPKTQSSIS